MENLTVEQALQNVTVVLEQFKGTKGEHILLEQSLNKVKENLIKVKESIKED